MHNRTTQPPPPSLSLSQEKLIKAAINELSGESTRAPNRPGQPAPSADSPKKHAQTSASTVVEMKSSGKSQKKALSEALLTPVELRDIIISQVSTCNPLGVF